MLPGTGPGAGSCESTSPTGRSDSTSVTWYGTLAWSSAALTSAICAPTKLPSVKGAFGGLKVSVMLPSFGTSVPVAGSCAKTMFSPTASLTCGVCVILPTKPRSVRSFVASSSGLFVSSGITMVVGPAGSLPLSAL